MGGLGYSTQGRPLDLPRVDPVWKNKGLTDLCLCLPSLLISVSEVEEVGIGHSLLPSRFGEPSQMCPSLFSNPTREGGDEEQLGRRRFWIEEWDGGSGFCCFDGWRVF